MNEGKKHSKVLKESSEVFIILASLFILVAVFRGMEVPF